MNTIRYIVEGRQNGNSFEFGSGFEHSLAFKTEAEAIAEAESRWNQDHDTADFMHGGDARFEWVVDRQIYNSDSEEWEHDDRVWSKQADES